jgi:hypothetical protein
VHPQTAELKVLAQTITTSSNQVARPQTSSYKLPCIICEHLSTREDRPALNLELERAGGRGAPTDGKGAKFSRRPSQCHRTKSPHPRQARTSFLASYASISARARTACVCACVRLCVPTVVAFENSGIFGISCLSTGNHFVANSKVPKCKLVSQPMKLFRKYFKTFSQTSKTIAERGP